MSNINIISQQDNETMVAMRVPSVNDAVILPSIPVVSQEYNEDIVIDNYRVDNEEATTLPSYKKTKKFVQLNFFGESVAETSSKRVKVRAHTRKRSTKKKNSKNLQDFVAKDDCIESRKLAGKLTFKEAIAYQESLKTSK